MSLDIALGLAEGLAAHRRGCLADAAAWYARILREDPQHAEACSLLGLTAYQTGDREGARHLLKRSIVFEAQIAETYNRLGIALKATGRFDEAWQLYRRTAWMAPAQAEVFSNLGNLLQSMSRSREAAALCRQALVLEPRMAEANNNLAHILLAVERPSEARHAARRAVLLNNDYAEACNNLGRVEERCRGSNAAFPLFRRALVLRPDYTEGHNNYGNVLHLAGEAISGICEIHRALLLDPCFAAGYVNLCGPLRDVDRPDASLTAVKIAAVLEPGEIRAQIGLGAALLDQGDAAGAFVPLERSLVLQPAEPRAFAGLLCCVVNRDEVTAEQQRALHEDFGRRMAVAVAQPAPLGQPLARLRLGYLSSDFRDHPVGNSMLAVLRQHNRQVFEIYCYAEVAQPDAVTSALRQEAEGWCDITTLIDAEVAERIRGDGIHILICLAGRFDRNRPQVAAYRAAPVQVSLHDVATSGLAEMDYIIGDRWLLQRQSEEYFSERRLFLPHFYLGALPGEMPAVDLAVPAEPPVFACFNNPSKFSPTVLGLWGRILAARPDARLVLKYLNRYACDSIRQRILEGLTAAGGRADQVTFIATGREDMRSFMARYNAVDVALDTMPFSGSTTSFQALLMGVPVVTWPWDRMVSRWTGAMLQALGLDEMIANSAEAYLNIALKLAEERGLWRHRRSEIRLRVLDRLCNATPWTRHLERLYNAIWSRHESRLSVKIGPDA